MDIEFLNIEDAKQYIREMKNKHNKYMKVYRSKDEKKQILKDISKRCYDKIREDEEKYFRLLEKKKEYYEENKQKIAEKNKQRYEKKKSANTI